MSLSEKNSEKFDLNVFLQAREKCIKTTDKIISEIQLGMNESDIKDLVNLHFKSIGVTKFWHATKIRIGSDTVKNFKEVSDPLIRCKKGDICFLDLGPIIDNHEADFGRTFLIQSANRSEIIEASHRVFEKTADEWKKNQLNGVALFEFASQLAKDSGYILNSQMSGHRLGDFPHKLFSSEALFEYNGVPSRHLWVLEIHLLDNQSQYGAFFEDILI